MNVLFIGNSYTSRNDLEKLFGAFPGNIRSLCLDEPVRAVFEAAVCRRGAGR